MWKIIINLAEKWSYLHRLFYFAFVYFGQRVWDPWTIQWHKEHSQHVEIEQSKMSFYALFGHQVEYWLWPEDQPKKLIMNKYVGKKILSKVHIVNYLQGATLMDRSKSLTDETGIVIQSPMFSRKRNKTFSLNKTPFTVCNLNYLDLLPVMKRI